MKHTYTKNVYSLLFEIHVYWSSIFSGNPSEGRTYKWVKYTVQESSSHI